MSELTELHIEIARCERCAQLARGRTNTVPGDGPDNAKIMFIGEAPGFHEDRQGIPFVGAAGKFLAQLLATIDMKREDVFICNMLKCRPPNNRDPLPQELDNCRPYLDRQMEIIKPKIVITLGRFSMSKFVHGVSISKVHGQPFKRGERLFIPMFHPAAALHQPRYRSLIEQDFLKIPEILADMADLEEDTPSIQGEQLSLF